MSVINWGLLAKSQIDAETIEEAIARLIGEHNANEEAHLAVGQSLQSHKAAEIIDHLARSVYRDKLIFDRFQFDEHFSTIDIWQKTAGATLDAISEFTLLTTLVLNDYQQAYLQSSDAMESQPYSFQNPKWETRVKFGYVINQEAYIWQGEVGGGNGFGFKIINGSVYASWFDDSFVEHSTLLSDIVITNSNIYRCELIDGVSLKWYVNNILKYTEVNISPADSNFYIFYYIKTTTTLSRRMIIQSLHFDANYY